MILDLVKKLLFLHGFEGVVLDSCLHSPLLLATSALVSLLFSSRYRVQLLLQ